MTIYISKSPNGISVSNEFPKKVMDSIVELGERECPMNEHIEVEFNWDFTIKK